MLFHLVGLLFNTNYDARNHELKINLLLYVINVTANKLWPSTTCFDLCRSSSG